MMERRFSLGAVGFSFLLGGLVGASLALLFAPASGQELRERIRSTTEETKERLREKAEELKSSAEELKERGIEILEEKKRIIEEAIEAGKEAMKREKERIASKFKGDS